MNPHIRQTKRKKTRKGENLSKKKLRHKDSNNLTNLFIKSVSVVILLAISVSVSTINYAFFGKNLAENYILDDEDVLPSSLTLAENKLQNSAGETQYLSKSLKIIDLGELIPQQEQEIEEEEPIRAEDLIQLHEDFKANLDSEYEEITELYESITAQIEEIYKLGEEIQPLYDSAKEAKVCSKANKFNNSLQEKYSHILTYFSIVDELYSQYEEKYETFEQHVDEFNSGAHLKPLVEINSPQEQYNVYMKYFFGIYNVFTYQGKPIPIEEVSATLEKLMEYKTEISTMASDAQQIADDFFNLVFYDMSHIANAEAGSNRLPPEDIYYVLNVVENRVESPKFRQDTTHDVIFAPGQYTPVKSGGFYMEPTDQVKERTETYLRGYVDTGMPSNVVFQAKGIQGDGIWKYMESSGHYFCYKNGA